MGHEGEPAGWDVEQLQQQWQRCLGAMIEQKVVNFPLKRLRYQAEQDPEYGRVVERWPELSAEERQQAWDTLVKVSQRAAGELLPVCVACGDCCRTGSPTLHHHDLELVRNQLLPWGQLVTLRPGEPVRSPFLRQPYDLDEERIKLRTRAGSHTCIFFDPDASLCRNYHERPAQCRAQACWDSSTSEGLLQEAYLSRRALFEAEVPALWQLIEEHERRCSFATLRAAVEALGKEQGTSPDAVVELLAFDEQLRDRVVEQLGVPRDNLDFLFGRSLVELVEVFGLEVERAADGTRTLRTVEQAREE